MKQSILNTFILPIILLVWPVQIIQFAYGAAFSFIPEGEDPLIENKPPVISRFTSHRELFPTSHLTLIAITEPQCTKVELLIGFVGATRIAPPELMTLGEIPIDQVDFPVSFCPQVAILPKHATSWREARLSPYDAQNLPQFSAWIREQMRVDVVFYNQLSFPVSLYWYEEGKEEVHIAQIEPNQQFNGVTFVGHIFVSRKSSDKALLGFWIMDGEKFFFIDRTLTECDEATQTCKNNEYIMTTEAFKLWYEKRRWLNYFQPKIVPGLTPFGYEKKRLPEQTWKWLQEFYERKSQNTAVEGEVGPCLNQHEAPSYLIELGSAEKNRLFRELQPVLEDWVNIKLIGTSCYGIRKYTNGSVLQMHVDTGTTHVASAIINIAQKVNSDWPLQIIDHDGKMHELAMEPGDMVLYESAKALHGRTKPLDGEEYSNVFIHYMPTEGWNFDWM